MKKRLPWTAQSHARAIVRYARPANLKMSVGQNWNDDKLEEVEPERVEPARGHNKIPILGHHAVSTQDLGGVP